MNRQDLADILGFDFLENKFGKASIMFYGKIIANYRNDSSDTYKWSSPISKDRLNKFRQSKGIEILQENETTCLYRCNGKLFVNKTENGITIGKRIL
jgi:hypothetical protein